MAGFRVGLAKTGNKPTIKLNLPLEKVRPAPDLQKLSHPNSGAGCTREVIVRTFGRFELVGGKIAT